MLWIKMYPAKCLRGNIHFDLSLSKRAIWYELLLMAGDQDNDGTINYPLPFIASQLGCRLKTLEEVLAVLQTTQRVSIIGNEITIINWFKYQSPKTKKQKAKELSALAKSLGFTSVEEYEANEDRLKREGKWQSEEDYLAEDAEVIDPGNGTDYTKAMFWADNKLLEANCLAGEFESTTKITYAETLKTFQDKYKGQYTEKDIKLFVTKFVNKREKETAKPV